MGPEALLMRHRALLLIFLASRVSGAECVALPQVRILALEVLGSLVVRLAPRRGPERRLESLAVDLVVLFEVVPQCPVVLGFGIADPDPPVVPRRIDALGAGLGQDLLRALGLRSAVRHNDNDAASLPQGVLIEEDLVGGQSLRRILVGL